MENIIMSSAWKCLCLLLLLSIKSELTAPPYALRGCFHPPSLEGTQALGRIRSTTGSGIFLDRYSRCHSRKMGQISLIVSKDFHLLAVQPLYYVILAVILIVSINYAFRPKKQRYAAAPIVCADGIPLAVARERFRKDARGMLREGYARYKGLPFYVPSPLGERLMIPARYVEELKTAPVDEVDFVGTFFEVH